MPGAGPWTKWMDQLWDARNKGRDLLCNLESTSPVMASSTPYKRSGKRPEGKESNMLPRKSLVRSCTSCDIEDQFLSLSKGAERFFIPNLGTQDLGGGRTFLPWSVNLASRSRSCTLDPAISLTVLYITSSSFGLSRPPIPNTLVDVILKPCPVTTFMFLTHIIIIAWQTTASFPGRQKIC